MVIAMRFLLRLGLAAIATAGVGSAASCATIANIRESIPGCEDGKMGVGEKGIDCGGPCIGKCPDEMCTGSDECASGVCSKPAGRCAAPACDDKIWNGQETDLNCGGGACAGCAAGKHCNAGCDCVSGDCSDGLCQPEKGDKKRCMMDACKDVCADSHPCNENVECASGMCVGGLCSSTAMNPCANAVMDGLETDVDCGGPDCPTCGKDRKCLVGKDCTSTVCSGTTCL
jgi:hypothetical protein